MNPVAPVQRRRDGLVLAVLVLGVGAALTLALAFWAQARIHGEASARFERQADRLQTDVQNRLNAALSGLRGAAGIYAASEAIQRAEFRAYVEFSQLTHDLPGLNGFGMIQRVPRETLASFMASERADEEPDFAVQTTGAAPDLYIVQFLEPGSQHQAALGLDLGADRRRRQAMEHAVATGLPTLSRNTGLSRDPHWASGLIYLLPVYRAGSDPLTPAQRKSVLVGLLFAPITVDEMMDAALVAAQGQADFHLVDEDDSLPEPLVYAASWQRAATQTTPRRPMFESVRSIAVGGRTLSLHAASTPGFDTEAASPLPVLLGLGGGALSLLLAVCLWLLGSSRARALALAQHMTLSLAQEQQRLRAIVEGTNAGTWEWNVVTGSIHIDARWAAMVGYRLDELVMLDLQDWRKLLHPLDLDRSDALVRRHFAGELPYYECETRLRHKDGRWVWVLARGRVSAWGGQRQALLMAGSVIDITERQTAQLALRNSEDNFRQLFETSQESILQTWPDGQVLNANPAACRLFGLGVDALRLLGPHGLVDPGDTRRQGLVDELQREGHASGELRMRRGDGSTFECELSSSIFMDQDNQPCANLVLRDITARKRSDARMARINLDLEQRVSRRTAQLEASNRDLQEFAHAVAHDLRQPFIAIGGFSGLLERRVDDERARHYLARIKAGVRQAGELTDALLALARLSRVALRIEAVDLSAMAQDVLDRLRGADPERVVDIQIQGDLQARADPLLMRLVMEQLLGNAWKFSSRRERAVISFGQRPAAGPGADTVYVLRDNGEGFDMAHADQLFRSFQRLHSPLDFPGAGVSLVSIQRIIVRHGGRIWAESVPGQGTSFFFTLGGQGG